MLRVLDLFSGIGGFSLGLEQTGGFETVAFCEIDKEAGKVLKKHWPNVPIFTDVKTLNKEEVDKFGPIDVICGGFPCQDLSNAGKCQGIHASRSGLWWEYQRLVSEIRPRFVLVENVGALLYRGMDEVLGGLSEIGYDAEWEIIRACDFGACHKRERLFMVAYPNGRRLDSPSIFKGEFNKTRHESDLWNDTTTEYLADFKRAFPKIPEHLRGGDGVFNELDRNYFKGDWKKGPAHPVAIRMKQLGNSIVPACSRYIGECVLEFEKQQLTP